MATLSSPAIEDLIAEVRSDLGQPSSTNSAWTDDDLTTYLNRAARRYFVEVVQHMEGQFTTTSDLSITANTETIALPSDCFRVKNVWRKVTDGYQILNYRNSIDMSYSTTGASGGDTYLPYYYFRGNSLVLRPVPNFSESAGIKIEYVQFPDTMVSGGDTLTAQVAPVFRDLIVAYAVYQAKKRESLVSGTATYGPAKEDLSDLYTAFKEAIGQRSVSPTFITPFNPEE